MIVAKTQRHQPLASRTHSTQGFTLIELMVVISIIGILASIVIGIFSGAREKAYLSRAMVEFRNIELALELYLVDNNNIYPPDVGRDISPGLEEYLGSGIWPKSPYPGGVYDWENWTINGEKVYQISIRFCDAGGANCNFPNHSWAENFDQNSAIFYCIQGSCRSHVSGGFNHPGYCVNCQGDDIIRGD